MYRKSLVYIESIYSVYSMYIGSMYSRSMLYV